MERMATIIVIGIIAAVAIAAATVMEITDHGSSVAVILGFATSLLVSLIALVTSQQAKTLLNGTKEKTLDLEERMTELESK